MTDTEASEGEGKSVCNISDDDWQKAVDCAARQFEGHYRNNRLGTPEERRGAIHDIVSHVIGILQMRELSAASEGEGWQPIETAPRDGTHILVRFGEDHVSSAAYTDDDSHTHPWKFLDDQREGRPIFNGARDDRYGPTGWMPLPSPLSAAPKPPQSQSLALAEENDNHTAKQHRERYDAMRHQIRSLELKLYVSSEENRVLREALELARTYVGDVWEPGRVNVSAHLAQIDAALSTARPSAQAYREAFDEMLKALKAAENLILRLCHKDSTPFEDSVWSLVKAAIAKVEACK